MCQYDRGADLPGKVGGKGEGGSGRYRGGGVQNVEVLLAGPRGCPGTLRNKMLY